MISLSGRVHLSFPPAAVEGRGGLQGGRFEASHRLEGGGRSGLDKVGGGGGRRGDGVRILSIH